MDIGLEETPLSENTKILRSEVPFVRPLLSSDDSQDRNGKWEEGEVVRLVLIITSQ